MSDFTPYEHTCPQCNRSYLRTESWKRICLDCYIAGKNKERAKERKQFDEHAYKEFFKQYPEPSKPNIEPEMLRRLIQLCHPDKWNNSVASQEATLWLLEQKKR